MLGFGKALEVFPLSFRDGHLRFRTPKKIKIGKSTKLKLLLPGQDSPTVSVKITEMDEGAEDFTGVGLVKEREKTIVKLTYQMALAGVDGACRRGTKRIGATIRLRSRQLPNYRGITANVNETGLEMHLDGPMSDGTPVSLELDVPEMSDMQIRGVSIWSVETELLGKPVFRVGVEISETDAYILEAWSTFYRRVLQTDGASVMMKTMGDGSDGSLRESQRIKEAKQSGRHAVVEGSGRHAAVEESGRQPAIQDSGRQAPVPPPAPSAPPPPQQFQPPAPAVPSPQPQPPSAAHQFNQPPSPGSPRPPSFNTPPTAPPSFNAPPAAPPSFNAPPSAPPFSNPQAPQFNTSSTPQFSSSPPPFGTTNTPPQGPPRFDTSPPPQQGHPQAPGQPKSLRLNAPAPQRGANSPSSHSFNPPGPGGPPAFRQPGPTAPTSFNPPGQSHSPPPLNLPSSGPPSFQPPPAPTQAFQPPAPPPSFQQPPGQQHGFQPPPVNPPQTPERVATMKISGANIMFRCRMGERYPNGAHTKVELAFQIQGQMKTVAVTVNITGIQREADGTYTCVGIILEDQQRIQILNQLLG